MAYCPFCHGHIDVAGTQRCAACGRTLVGVASISAEEVGAKNRTANRRSDLIIFHGVAIVLTLVIWFLYGWGYFNLALALVSTIAACQVIWRWIRSRTLAMLAYAVPQILLYGVGASFFFATLASLVAGMIIGIYRSQLRDTHS